MQRPLILFAGALIAGIALGELFLYLPWTTILFSAVLFASLVLTACFSRSARSRALTAASGIAVGMVLLVHSVFPQPGHYGTLSLFTGRPHDVTGRIASPLERDPGRIAFLLDVERVDGTSASGRMRVAVRGEPAGLGYGDRVRLAGRIYPPRGYRNPGGFDYPGFLARQGVSAVLSVRDGPAVDLLEGGTGILRTIQDWRERIRRNFLSATTGDGSAVLQAMVLGEEGGLTDDLRDRFLAAGVTHILSISGSHLGLVALLCFWSFGNALFLLPERSYHRFTLHADRAKTAALLTLGPVTFYAFLAGGQVATLRALIMIVAGLAALLLDREGDGASALALAAIITLVPAPQALFDLSFQLSYLSVLTILFVVKTWRSLGFSGGGFAARLFRKALLLLAISVAATLATAPIVVSSFHQISLAGIVANMVVVPFAGAVVVPAGLVSGVCSLVTGSLPFAGLVQAVADLFVSLVSFFARLPGAVLSLPSPGPLFFAGYAGLLAAAAFAGRARLIALFRPLESSRRPRPFVPLLAVLAAIVLTASLAVPVVRGRASRMTVVDVGQGDCELVETAGGKTILIDGGGTRDNRFDIGRRVVLPFLREEAVGTIDLLILSHPHPDHMNGLVSVVRAMNVGEAWLSGMDEGLPGYDDLRRALRDRNVPCRVVSAGRAAHLGAARIAVLHPAAGNAFAGPAYAAENDRSLVVRVDLEGRSMLFAGDIHAEGEEALLRRKEDLGCDILKVPHHGSRSSSSPSFVAAVRPSFAVMTVGEGNPYRHPSPDVVERYEASGSRVLRTDRDGAIIVRDLRNGPSVTAWTDLLLRKAALKERERWWTIERENWRRIVLRTAGI